MRSSALYLALIACVASASAAYTNGEDFFKDLPTCIQDCNSVIIDNVKAACNDASNSLECICTQIDAPGVINETVSDTASACSLKCSEDDQNALMKLGLEMASSCVPYLDSDGSSDNSTSAMSSGSMSGTATATGASSTGGSTSTATAAASGSGSATQSPSGTASSAPVATGAAGQLVLGGALLIPALLAGLMI
ncbi:hypothetical protein DFP73DRAFT_600111 [Morchella snyderi]|nr:hypothetical protein DFP73DRAFT_600111 [Morchella snyderi]